VAHFPRLAAYLKKAETAEVPFRGKAMQALGDGIATVLDSTGDADVYFDRELWEPD